MSPNSLSDNIGLFIYLIIHYIIVWGLGLFCLLEYSFNNINLLISLFAFAIQNEAEIIIPLQIFKSVCLGVCFKSWADWKGGHLLPFSHPMFIC